MMTRIVSLAHGQFPIFDDIKFAAKHYRAVAHYHDTCAASPAKVESHLLCPGLQPSQNPVAIHQGKFSRKFFAYRKARAVHLRHDQGMSSGERYARSQVQVLRDVVSTCDRGFDCGTAFTPVLSS